MTAPVTTPPVDQTVVAQTTTPVDQTVVAQTTTPAENTTEAKSSSSFSTFLGYAGTFLAVLGAASLATDMSARSIVVLTVSTGASLVKPISKLAMDYVITPGMNLASAAAGKATDFYNSGVISSSMKSLYNMLPSIPKSA